MKGSHGSLPYLSECENATRGAGVGCLSGRSRLQPAALKDAAVFTMCVLTDNRVCVCLCVRVHACLSVCLPVCDVSPMPGASLQTQHVDVFGLVTCKYRRRLLSRVCVYVVCVCEVQRQIQATHKEKSNSLGLFPSDIEFWKYQNISKYLIISKFI